ncbi:MAG: dTMP kinase [Clostridiales bacterium]|nr:dTMP kinase [Clostridiales bacterium]
MEKGLFITFEGIDGCGKSTQFELLKDHVQKEGKDILVVREPGGTVIGEKIREILLNKKNDSMVPMAELFLFEAARAQITEEKIRPALEAGTIVLCDRFFDSTYAYQGYARNLGSDVVGTLNNYATSGLEPDITFLIDVPVEVALQRRGIRNEADDRMEALGIKFQEDVRKGYLEAAGKFKRIKVIDGNGTPESIFEEIKKIYEAAR